MTSHERLKPVASRMLQILREECQQLLQANLETETARTRMFTIAKINIAEADVLERYLAEKLEQTRSGLGTVVRPFVFLRDNHLSNTLPAYAEDPELIGEKEVSAKTTTPQPAARKSATPVPNP